MNATLIVKNTLPHKDFTSIMQLGLKAANLALQYASELGPRLPEGMLEVLSKDLEALGDVVPNAIQARGEAIAATSAQYAAVEEGYMLVRQVRAAIRRAKAPSDVKRAYGVGQKVARKSVRDVKSAIGQIVGRAKEKPEEAASLGIVAKDLENLTDSLAAITAADASQEQKRASAPLSTQERNRIGNRILAAVARIEGAGRMEFAGDEGIRASFEALGAGPKRKRKVDEGATDVAAVVS